MKEFGYAGGILKVDLSTGSSSKYETADYADRFIGGRGVAAKLYWDFVPPETGALDPDNGFICTTGPVAGFNGFAGGRWQICGKSPLGNREAFSYANLGGKWGINLKYAGYDGLVVQGKAEKPVYLVITNDRVEIKDASRYRGKTAFDTSDGLKKEHGSAYSVLTIGPAAENLVPWATVLTDEGSSASAGMGAVMASKNLKAILVAGDGKPEAADPGKLSDLKAQVKELIKKSPYDDAPWGNIETHKPQACYGCGLGCGRNSYKYNDGRKYKSLCQATMFYFRHIIAYDGKLNNETRFLATRLCDGYGLDTSVIHGMIDWLAWCHANGIIDEETSGLPLSKIGSAEFIEKLTRIISYREGFGDILAGGTIEAALSIGAKAMERMGDFIANRNSETKDYDPRLIPATAMVYALEPRRAIQTFHEPLSYLYKWLDSVNKKENATYSSDVFRKYSKRMWGSEEAADFTTMEGKALASKKSRDRAYVKDSMILCDLRWMRLWPDHFIDNIDQPALEPQIFSAVTGKEVDEAGLNRFGERIVNLQRAILLRQGWKGRDDDQLMDYYFHQPLRKGELFCDPECIVPGKNDDIVSREGAVLDRQAFEKLKDEYYALRGWDIETGFPKAATLKDFDMEDVAEDLAGRGLLK